ncbi:WIYLD domain [Sesbania bispinosa]|nr:WIYLD domain [Sesbania bispinosa]
MKEFGISKAKLTETVEDLLKVYCNNWKFIEDDNYRVLMDAILERKDEDKEVESQKEAQIHDDPLISEPLKKRLRPRTRRDRLQVCEHLVKRKSARDKKQIVVYENSIYHGDDFCSWSAENSLRGQENGFLFEDCIPFGEAYEEVPLKSLNPAAPTGTSSDVMEEETKFLQFEHLNVDNKGSCDSSRLQFDIASSSKGDVSVSIICNSSQSDYHIPSLDAVLKAVEEKYKLHKSLDSDFSVMKLMRDVCECFLAMAISSSVDRGLWINNVSLSKECDSSKDYGNNFSVHLGYSNYFANFHNLVKIVPQIPKSVTLSGLEGLHYICGFRIPDILDTPSQRERRIKFLEHTEFTNSNVVAGIEKDCSSAAECCYIDDITRGEEKQGITTDLQVFRTPEGKGWGIRTLKDLPKGAFVCEFAGEVVTNLELRKRIVQSIGEEKHTYTVLLDADWCSENILKDEETLCLDATLYGNVSRFINHRWTDASLLEIPVEVETPDHHYYHLAFFTTRKVSAMEELTWDYGIDFNDQDHPVKAFRCLCNSPLCRDQRQKNDCTKIQLFSANLLELNTR